MVLAGTKRFLRLLVYAGFSVVCILFYIQLVGSPRRTVNQDLYHGAQVVQHQTYNDTKPGLVDVRTQNVIRPVPNYGKSLTMVMNDTVAKAIQQEIRILCWIAVSESSRDRAEVIQQTWGRRCTKLLFIGDETTSDFPEIITLKVPTGRHYLWDKTREAFRYVYDNHFEDADWFLKADTDTYVIMENLRHLVLQQDPEQPAYLGCQINLYVKQGYNSGGAGYVLNRLSLKRLVTEGYKEKKCMDGYMEDEDVSMGYCMSTIGIKPGDPTDALKRNRFFPFEPSDHTSLADPGNNKWYWRSTQNAGEKSLNCCSDTWVSFHYVSPQLMWNMEFLIYHTTVFGITTSLEASAK